MKPRFIATAVLCIALLVPQASRAASMAIGMNTWYNWWDNSNASLLKYFYHKYEYTKDPFLLFGPVLSFQITEKWNLSTLFNMGCYKFVFTGEEDGDKYTNKTYLWRYDSDTTASYAFKPYFRLYFGFKYLGYTCKNKGQGFGSSIKSEGVSNIYSPGIGVIFNISLMNDLYFSFSLGALYGFQQTTSDDETTDLETGDKSTDSYSDDSINIVALNSRISLGYNIECVHMVVCLGFRYQVSFFFSTYDDNYYLGDIQHNYGIESSATFYFDI